MLRKTVGVARPPSAGRGVAPVIQRETTKKAPGRWHTHLCGLRVLAHFKCEGALEINGGLAATSLRAFAPVIQRKKTKKHPIGVLD